LKRNYIKRKNREEAKKGMEELEKLHELNEVRKFCRKITEAERDLNQGQICAKLRMD
jgi:hypothetical protein